MKQLTNYIITLYRLVQTELCDTNTDNDNIIWDITRR